MEEHIYKVGFLLFHFLLMTAEQIYDDRLSGEKKR
jgi:hypothetical protein